MSGQRPSRKIRAIAARFPELGEIRYVEGNPLTGRVVFIAAAFVLFCTMAPIIGNGGVVDGLITGGFMLLFTVVVLWYLGSEKFVVLERGVLIGSVAPFLKPYVVPFHRLDASTVTTCRPVHKVGAMVVQKVPLKQGRNTVWGHNGIVFQAAGVPATRQFAEKSGVFAPVGAAAMEAQLDPGIWWFGTSRPTDDLVRALESAMTTAGAPVAGGMAARALPQVRISGKPEDAVAQVPHLLQLDRRGGSV